MGKILIALKEFDCEFPLEIVIDNKYLNNPVKREELRRVLLKEAQNNKRLQTLFLLGKGMRAVPNAAAILNTLYVEGGAALKERIEETRGGVLIPKTVWKAR